MDDPAFKIFYEAMARPLWAYVFRMTGDRELAQDITQDAFVRWVRNAPLSLPEPAKKAYLYRIATNLVYDHRRRFGKISTEEIDETLEASVADPELKMDFHQAFEKLNAQSRALLWLAYAEDYSHEEIAEILKLKPGSVKVLLFRARKRLTDIFHQLDFRRTS